MRVLHGCRRACPVTADMRLPRTALVRASTPTVTRSTRGGRAPDGVLLVSAEPREEGQRRVVAQHGHGRALHPLLPADEVADGHEVPPEALALRRLGQVQVAHEQHGLAGHLAGDLCRGQERPGLPQSAAARVLSTSVLSPLKPPVSQSARLAL